MATRLPILHSMGIDTTMTHEDGKVIVDNVQDVEPAIERNKELQKLGNGAVTPGDKDSMRLVASIPILVWKRMQRKGLVDKHQRIVDPAGFIKYLNDHPHLYASTTRIGKQNLMH